VINRQNNNANKNKGFLSTVSTSLFGNSNKKNTRKNNNNANKNANNNANNQRKNNQQNNQGLPSTVNNVNANMNEEQEPISYSRQEELIKYGNLNGLEPANLASRYHNIFNAEGKERKRSRKRKNRKSLKRKTLRRKTLKRK
jgi:hypothetical protein